LPIPREAPLIHTVFAIACPPLKALKC